LLMAFFYDSAWGSGWGIASAPAQAADKGWILQQNKMAVPCVLYISPNGIKFGPDPFGVSYVSKGPDWTLYLYDDKKKAYFRQSPETWASMSKAMPGALSTVLGSREYTKGGATTIAGLPATQYRKLAKGEWTEVYVAKDMVMSDQLNRLAEYILGTPSGVHDKSRIMLRREVVDGHGRRTTIINTTTARRADLPSGTFDTPRDYKAVQTIDDLGGK
jgi:hypothetical protein